MADPVINAGNFTDYASYLQNEQVRQYQNDLATKQYNDAKARGESEDRALAAAKFAWDQVKDRANLTGRFEDQWTFPSMTSFATMFGTWMPNGPTPGQETMAREAQTFTQGQNLGAMYGQYYAPGQAPAYGTQTQAALEQAQKAALAEAGVTGWYTPTVNNNVSPARFNYDTQPGERQAYIDAAQGDTNLAAQNWAANQSNAVAQFNAAHPQQAQQTLTGQQQQWNQAFAQQNYEAQQRQLAQSNTLQYLQQLANLRGPADWAKYQEVLGSTPQGMRDLYAAAMGQYVPGGGATTGQLPQAANLNTMMQQIGGYNPQAQAQGGSVWGGGYTPQQGELANPQGVYNTYWNRDMGNQYTPIGQTSPNYYASQYANGGQGAASAFTPQGANQAAAGATPQYQQAQQAMGNGTNVYGAPQRSQYNLPAPNQVAPQAWKNLTPSQQEMMKGDWEAQGWYKPDVEALMNQALPKYASNASTAGTWRLQ